MMATSRVRAAGTVTLLALATLQTPVPSQSPTFRAKAEAVRVDVLVTDGNRVVTGLRSEDFEVRDNGVIQRLDVVAFAQVSINVVLALDASDSLTTGRLAHLQSAASVLLTSLEPSDSAALVTFNDVVTLGSAPTRMHDAVRTAIRRVTGGGGTALYDAVHTAIVIADSDVGRNLLVLFTDGTDTSSYLTRQTVLDTARHADVVAYPVITGRSTDFVTSLADATGGRVLSVQSPQELTDTFSRVLQEFRQRYLLSYTPTGVAGAGWHRVEVRVKGRSLTVRARNGYQAGW